MQLYQDMHGIIAELHLFSTGKQGQDQKGFNLHKPSGQVETILYWCIELKLV